MSIAAYYLAVAPILVGLILVLLLAAMRHRRSVISAERTPVHPPAPTRLVPLTPPPDQSIFPMPDMELMGGIDGARPVKRRKR